MKKKTASASAKPPVKKTTTAKKRSAKSSIDTPAKTKASTKKSATAAASTPRKTYIKFLNPQYSIVYGFKLSITATLYRLASDAPLPQFPLKLRIGKKEYDAVKTDSFGRAHWLVRPPHNLEPGTYEIVARFAGNSELDDCEKTAPLKIFIANSSLKAEVKPLEEEGQFKLRAILNDEQNEPIVDREVDFKINNKFRWTIKTNDKGVALKVYHPSAPGNKLSVEFAGDKFYRSDSATAPSF